jgi:hypothetical protein
MIEIRFDKTKDEVALLIWFLDDHSVSGQCAFLRYIIGTLDKIFHRTKETIAYATIVVREFQ